MELEAPDIVDIVSQYIDLTEVKGSRPYYSGQCPFHDDDNPSFVVYPNIQKWVCYGCSPQYSDVYSFVARKTGRPIAEVKKDISVKLDPRQIITKKLQQSIQKEPAHDTDLNALRLRMLFHKVPIDKAMKVMLEYDTHMLAGRENAADMLLRGYNV